MKSGYWNSSILWELDEDGTLTITETKPQKYRNSIVGVCPADEKASDRQWQLPFDKKKVKKLVINEGIHVIDNRGFESFTELKEVVFPPSLGVIGAGAFHNCGKLVSVELPQELWVASNAFDGFECINNLILPAIIERIPQRILNHIKNSERIMADPANKVYDSRNDCNALIETRTGRLIKGCSKTIIPADISVIGEFAFSDCGELEKVRIPGNIRELEKYAFAGCPDLKEVYIEEGLTEIGSFSFQNCVNLRRIHLPSSIRKIGRSAFEFCRNLSEAVLPEGLRMIEEGAFKECEKLNEVVLPDGIVAIERYAFPYNAMIVTGNMKYIQAVIDDCHAVLYTGGPLDDFDSIEWKKNGFTMTERKEKAVEGFLCDYGSADRKIWKWKDSYLRYIEKRKPGYLMRAANFKDAVLLSLLLEFSMINERETEVLIKRAIETEKPQITASLIDYKKKHFGMDQKDDSLDF